MARDSALTRDRALVVVSENTSATTANSQTGQPNTEDINQQILEVSFQFYNYKHILTLHTKTSPAEERARISKAKTMADISGEKQGIRVTT